MSWNSARESAALLAERLKLFERKPSVDRRKGQASRQPAAEKAESAAAVYVKPSRVMAPEPPPPTVAETVMADLTDADLLEPAHAPEAETEAQASEPEAAELAETRRAPRKSHMLPAYVTAQGMANIIPARVLDMSATGAKIELTPMGRATGVPMTHLPDRFTLVLRQDKMDVDCEIVWREEWIIGVRFLGFPRPSQTRK